ncbi:hypothetical protein GGH95_002511, partial [Coemansia sp. RSA 1836]
MADTTAAAATVATTRSTAAATLQIYWSLVRDALTSEDSSSGMQALTMSLLAVHRIIATMPEPHSRTLALAVANLVILLTRKTASRTRVDVSAGASSTALDRRLQLLGFVGSLVLLSMGAAASGDTQQTGTSVSMLLASLRAERARFSRLLQAHMRLAAGIPPRARFIGSSARSGQQVVDASGIAPLFGVRPATTRHLSLLHEEPEGSFDDVVVP